MLSVVMSSPVVFDLNAGEGQTRFDPFFHFPGGDVDHLRSCDAVISRGMLMVIMMMMMVMVVVVVVIMMKIRARL